MSQMRLWGISLMVVCIFKVAMTQMLGVQADPVNLAMTSAAFVVGFLLVVGSCNSAGRERRRSDLYDPHSTERSPGLPCRCVDKPPMSAKQDD